MKKIILHLEKLSFFASKTFLFFIIFILLLICAKKLSVQWEETENNKKLKRPYDGAIQSIST